MILLWIRLYDFVNNFRNCLSDKNNFYTKYQLLKWNNYLSVGIRLSNTEILFHETFNYTTSTILEISASVKTSVFKGFLQNKCSVYHQDEQSRL